MSRLKEPAAWPTAQRVDSCAPGSTSSVLDSPAPQPGRSPPDRAPIEEYFSPRRTGPSSLAAATGSPTSASSCRPDQDLTLEPDEESHAGCRHHLAHASAGCHHSPPTDGPGTSLQTGAGVPSPRHAGGHAVIAEDPAHISHHQINMAVLLPLASNRERISPPMGRMRNAAARRRGVLLHTMGVISRRGLPVPAVAQKA